MTRTDTRQMFLILPVAFFGLFLYVLTKVLKAAVRSQEVARFGNGNGLAEYKDNHPDCCRDGTVACYACGGGDIWLEKVADDCFNHRCRACATLLYQSNTRYPAGTRQSEQYRNLREWMEGERRKRQLQAHRTEPRHDDERVH